MTTVLSLLLCSPAFATEIAAEVYGGYQVVPPRLEVAPGMMLGGRLRYRWSDNWGVELAAGMAPEDSAGEKTSGVDPRAELVYFFAPSKSRVTPFVGMGPGLWLGEAETGWLIDVGPGIDAELLKFLDLRADLRMRTMGGSFSPVFGVASTLGLQFHTPRVHDTDNDGIVDKSDSCKDQAEDKDGFQDEDGCPEADNDQDGIADAADRCPIQAEDLDKFEDEDGCPDLDNDGDAVPDTADQCPLRKEDIDNFQDADGCPDRDNDQDGFADAKDKCPNEAEVLNGFEDKDGCPDEVPQAVKKFSGRIEGIYFKTNSAVIDAKSFPVLDGAAAVLQQFPEIKLEVQGHTDDVGDDAKNQKLSQDRAQSVMDYLVSKGISKDRLTAKGYGETKPEVANDSDEHRAQNRRVEFIIQRGEKEVVRDDE